MRTIIIAAVIAITAGIIYQKIADENIGIEEIAGYVTDTASKMINETKNTVNDKDLTAAKEEMNTVTENLSEVIQESKEKFIKEQLPEMINTDMQKVWQSVTCDKALSIYNNYISGNKAKNENEENVYAMLDIMRKKHEDDKTLKNNIIKLFCNDKN